VHKDTKYSLYLQLFTQKYEKKQLSKLGNDFNERRNELYNSKVIIYERRKDFQNQKL